MTNEQIAATCILIMCVVVFAISIPLFMKLRANMKEMRRLIDEMHNEENEDAD